MGSAARRLSLGRGFLFVSAPTPPLQCTRTHIPAPSKCAHRTATHPHTLPPLPHTLPSAESRASMRRRGAQPLLVESELKLARFIAGLHVSWLACRRATAALRLGR